MELIGLRLKVLPLASANIAEPKCGPNCSCHCSEPGVRSGVVGWRGKDWFWIDGHSHLCKHLKDHLLGLVEGIQVALKVVLLEDETLSVDLSLAVLSIETQNLYTKKGEGRAEGRGEGRGEGKGEGRGRDRRHRKGYRREEKRCGREDKEEEGRTMDNQVFIMYVENDNNAHLRCVKTTVSTEILQLCQLILQFSNLRLQLPHLLIPFRGGHTLNRAHLIKLNNEEQ